MDNLIAEIEAAILARTDIQPAFPAEHGYVRLEYSRLGWLAKADVKHKLRNGRSRVSEVSGSVSPTVAGAVEDLLRSLPFWGQALTGRDNEK